MTFHSPCDCLEQMRIKIDSELDRLRGEFRRKENDVLNPIINRYNILEQKVETC